MYFVIQLSIRNYSKNREMEIKFGIFLNAINDLYLFENGRKKLQ